MSGSPWIDELDKSRIAEKLDKDIVADLVVIGAGIAGISTAFFVLENTNHSVLVLEGGLLAHGASGHNAGMISGDTEKPMFEIEKMYGPELTKKLVSDFASGWELLELIAQKIKISYSMFVGYGGMRTFEDVMVELRNRATRRGLGFDPDPIIAGDIVISNKAPYLADIPEDMMHKVRLGSPEEIRELLHTKSNEFNAAVPERLGVMNSALFCQEAVRYLQETYKERFSLFEHTRVNRVALHADGVVVDAGEHTVDAKKVILCTNGFENFSIFNNNLRVDTSFHETVSGVVGYMLGLKAEYDPQPGGAWFMVDKNLQRGSAEEGHEEQEAPYIYVTHRPRSGMGEPYSLVCVGGHEEFLPDHTAYQHDKPYPAEVRDNTRSIFFDLWAHGVSNEPLYEWHGLMGYTKSGVRLAGVEPQNPNLLYNLGCNGIGILPSLVGGQRIAKILSKEVVEQSILDPKVQSEAK